MQIIRWKKEKKEIKAETDKTSNIKSIGCTFWCKDVKLVIDIMQLLEEEFVNALKEEKDKS